MINNLVLVVLMLQGVLTLILLIYLFRKTRNLHLLAFQLREHNREVLPALLVREFQQKQILDKLCYELDLPMGLPLARGWAASPDFLSLIARNCLSEKPLTVVECSSGTSTIVLARCMKLNNSGHVYSLEHDKEFAEVTRNRLKRYKLERWATVIDAPLQTHVIAGKAWNWYSLNRLPEFEIDLLVIDGPPATNDALSRYPAGSLLFSKLSQVAVVYVDDAARDGEKKIVADWMREYPALDSVEHYCEKGAVELKWRKCV